MLKPGCKVDDLAVMKRVEKNMPCLNRDVPISMLCRGTGEIVTVKGSGEER
jgi:hypothetical protein